MSTLRETIRAARNEVLRLAGQQGQNLDEERKQKGANIRTLTHAATKLVNEAVPVVARSRLVVDNPVIGTFDGANTSFTLSFPVSGNEIQVIFGDVSAGTTAPLVRSNVNPPSVGGFYFDGGVNKKVIVVNTPPEVVDALMAVYNTER